MVHPFHAYLLDHVVNTEEMKKTSLSKKDAIDFKTLWGKEK